MIDLKNKKVLITGATGGIGSELVKKFIGLGAEVLGTGTKPDKLDLLKAAIRIMEPNYGFDLETYAEFTPGTGLGGSSALVVAVLGALNYFQNEDCRFGLPVLGYLLRLMSQPVPFLTSILY